MLHKKVLVDTPNAFEIVYLHPFSKSLKPCKRYITSSPFHFFTISLLHHFTTFPSFYEQKNLPKFVIVAI